MIRSTDECEMSRSCHSATSSNAACRLPRRTPARPVSCSDLTGFRLCGIALEPFCSPSRNGSSTSRTSVRWRWRISSANDSIVAPSDVHAYMTSAWRSRASTCVAGTGRSPSRSHTYCSTSGSTFEYVPTAPDSFPTAMTSRARSRRSRSRRTCIAHNASFTPNVVGSAWMPCVRPTIGVSRNSRRERRSAPSSCAAAGMITSIARVSSAARARCRRHRST